MNEEKPLAGRVTLVAGATRGAGRAIAGELARAGAYVYATGRSSRSSGRSEIDRPETIEETGALMEEAAAQGTALVVDHEDPEAVAELVARIDTEQGRLDVLVNDIFGGDRYAQWDKPLWEHDLAGGLRMLRMGVDTHLVTSATAMPLLLQTGGGLVIEMTDGTTSFNSNFRTGVGFYYDLGQGQRRTHRQGAHLRARRPSRDGAGRHAGVATLGADARGLWGERGELAGRLPRHPRVRHLRVTHLRRPRRRRPGRRRPRV